MAIDIGVGFQFYSSVIVTFIWTPHQPKFNFRVGLLMDVNREGPCVPLQCVSNYRSAFAGGALAENALAYYQSACMERVLL